MADQIFLAPLRSLRPEFDWRSRLEGTFYTFRAAYNTRRKLWHLDLGDADGSPLALGHPLLSGISIFEPFRGLIGFPPGQILLEDTSGAGRDPGRNDLRGDFRMKYRPLADVLELEGTALGVR